MTQSLKGLPGEVSQGTTKLLEAKESLPRKMSSEHIGVGTDDSLLSPGHAFHEQNSHGPGDAFMVSVGEDLHMWKEHG